MSILWLKFHILCVADCSIFLENFNYNHAKTKRLKLVNLEHIRRDIILKKGIHYFDYTASGLAYKPIEDEVADILKTYANTHSLTSSNAYKTQLLYDNARSELKRALGLDDRFYLIATGYGATGAIKKFQELLGLYVPPAAKRRFDLKPNNDSPLVILGPYEHHSNEISFKEALCEVERIRLAKDGGINFGHLEQILKINQGREIIASFSAASNVTGVKTDYKRIYSLVKKFGGVVAFDCAATSSHEILDAAYFDAAFFSPHKLLGGVGSCGFLAIKKELYTSDIPSFAGGGTIALATPSKHLFIKNVEQLEEAGTPSILGLVRASLAYNLQASVGVENIKAREDELANFFEKELSSIEDITIYGPKNAEKLPIFSFNVRDISPYDFAATLSNNYGIQSRAGVMCAGPYAFDLLGLKENKILEKKPGFVRVSMHYTHTKEDVLYLINAIKSSIKKHRELWGEEKAMYEMFGGKI